MKDTQLWACCAVHPTTTYLKRLSCDHITAQKKTATIADINSRSRKKRAKEKKQIRTQNEANENVWSDCQDQDGGEGATDWFGCTLATRQICLHFPWVNWIELNVVCFFRYCDCIPSINLVSQPPFGWYICLCPFHFSRQITFFLRMMDRTNGLYVGSYFEFGRFEFRLGFKVRRKETLVKSIHSVDLFRCTWNESGRSMRSEHTHPNWLKFIC